MSLLHRRYRGRVDAFVDDELDPSWRIRMYDHLRQCPECGGTVLATVELKAALGRIALVGNAGGGHGR